MKPLWTPLLYLHGHALPDLRWREDAAGARGHRSTAPTPKPLPPMLRWRNAVRAALIV
jgi:hypothetical protein